MVGKEIKKKREEKKITQSELGKLVGCCRGNIARIETDKQYPSFQLMEKLYKVLQIDAEKIFKKNKKKMTTK